MNTDHTGCAPSNEIEQLLLMCDTIAEECALRGSQLDATIQDALAHKHAISVMQGRVMELRAKVESGRLPAQAALNELESPLQRELVSRKFNASEFAGQIHANGNGRAS